MKSIFIRLVSNERIEAEIECDGCHAGKEDYYATVRINELFDEKRIYGVDPTQALVLAMKLVEELSQEKRTETDQNSGAVVGAGWTVEVESV